MSIKRLDAHKYSNCYIERNGNIVDFVSYSSRIVSIDISTGWVRCYTTPCYYSATTRKQTGWFCKEFNSYFVNRDIEDILSYQRLKDMYINNYDYNYQTGEIEKYGHN